MSLAVAATTPLPAPAPAPVDVPMHVRLADGSALVLRRLDRNDEPALSYAIDHADPMDLRRRFMGVPPPTPLLLRRMSSADGVHDYALGAFTESGRLVGVAQFDREDEGPTAEFAIEVARDWQRRGLGRRLLERLGDVARSVGVHRLTATYYADNLPVRRLMHSSGRVLASGFDQGEGYAVIDLDR